jgi:hypothetical protein
LSATDWRRSHHLPQTTISGFIQIGQSQNLQTVYSKSSPSGCIYRLGKGHDASAIRSRFPGVNGPRATAQDAALIAVETSFALSISGSAKMTVRFVTKPQDEFDAQPQRPRVVRERQLGKQVS